MKKLLTILTTLLIGVCFAKAHSYTSSSVLSEGTWVKIMVRQSGIYSISYDDIRKLGLDPANIRVYGYGGAMLTQNFTKTKIDDLPLVPVYINKGSDGVFSSGDNILFYGQGSVNWTFNGTNFTHTRNPYSDYGYYFLTSSKGSTQEITTAAAVTAAATKTISTYTALQLHEIDSINLVDRKNVEGGGREFYGEQFTPNDNRTFSFTFENLTRTNKSLRFIVDLAGFSSSTSIFTVTHESTMANETIPAIQSSDFYTKAAAKTAELNVTPSAGNKQNINITFKSSSATALGNLNYIEAIAECALTLTPNQPLFFRTKDGYGQNSYLQYNLAGASAETQIWDITDLQNIQRVSTTLNGTTLSFKANNRTIHEYVAFNPSTSSFLSPITSQKDLDDIAKAEKKSFSQTCPLGAINTQNLHALSDIDLVIITPEEFLPEAQRLGNAHAQYDNMTVAVVTDQQVYNEFSSGTPDATAYRWLMKMLYDRARLSGGTIHKPGYLLLFGDGTFDNRKLLAASGNNWLLTYQAKNSLSEIKAYATDDYFAFLDDNEGENDLTGRMDCSVGRLPVNSTAQAQGVVDKLIRHMQNGNKGRWKNQMVFLADDGDSNLHTKGADAAAEAVRLHNPSFIVNKIYLDSYTQEVNASGESYPLAETRLNNLLREGVLLFDYCGHSGYNNATNEGLISIATIRKMQNDNLGLWMFASCSFALFDAGKTSGAEEAILNSEGGALAVCAADRTVFANQNAILNRHICDSLFAHSNPFDYNKRIGDAVRLGKNATGSDENKMAYVLLGDPAISLRYPTQYEVVTSSIPDTLNALSVNEVSGFLRAEDGDTALWFNGRLSITIFDKMQQITTLDNDQNDPDDKEKYTFNDYPNTLFQGETDVVDGKFSFRFMVPKDVRYNFGNGRIVYYAFDSENGEEACGHHESFIIGGSSPVEIIDTVGPNLNVYINSPSFTDGDQSNETPHFYAELSDEHGINTVGSGIGHDILLIVDDKADQTFVLNDYFSATNNSYQEGVVSYRMAELAEGRHSLFFRAWDLLNNSSSQTITFEVVKGLDPNVVSVMSYPNPVTSDGLLNIEVDYTQPDVIMQTDIYIYDMSGRLVHSISQRGTERITWDLGADSTPAGVYLYKVQLSSPTTKTVSKTGKLVVTK